MTKTKIYRPAVAYRLDELPEDVAKAFEEKDIDKMYYATVEAPDREKDVVRVSGLDVAKYTQHGGSLSVLIAHNRKPAPGAALPIAGKIVSTVPTKHKATGLPALAVGVKFLDTPVGRETKTQADADVLAVSIGFEPIESSPIKGGGFDYTKAALIEMSVCVNGMNQYAGPIKSDDGDEPDRTDEVLSALKQINSRLDDIECLVAAKPKEAAPLGDHDEQQATDPARDLLRSIGEALKANAALIA